MEWRSGGGRALHRPGEGRGVRDAVAADRHVGELLDLQGVLDVEHVVRDDDLRAWNVRDEGKS